jgi:hypothetical protein
MFALPLEPIPGMKAAKDKTDHEYVRVQEKVAARLHQAISNGHPY